MRIYDAATGAYLQARAGTVSRAAVYIEALNSETGEVEPFGIWTGEDSLTIEIEGVLRTYIGAGAMLQPDPVKAVPGLEVRNYQVRLSAVSSDVENLVKGFTTRFAPSQVHRIFLDPQSRAVVGVPKRVYRGLMDVIEFPRSRPGEVPACIVNMVSETRGLTRTLPLKKSQSSHEARGGDQFRRYGDISGAVPVYWGERKHAPAVAVASTPSTSATPNESPNH